MKNRSLHKKSIWFTMLIMLFMIACTKTEPLFQRLSADHTGITFSNKIKEKEELNIIDYTNMYNGGGVAIADFNNDGWQDIYFTGTSVNNELYLNQGEFEFKNVTQEANVAAHEKWSAGVAVVDINSDDLMDLYICATTSNESDRRTNIFYINQGVNENNVPVFKDMAVKYNVSFTGHSTMAAFFDYDNDGDLDLYLMVNQFNSRNSMNPYAQNSGRGDAETRDRLFRNEGIDSLGHPYFQDVSEEAGIVKEGFGLGLNIMDVNKDGWKDIYVANDFYTTDLFYINNGDGTFTEKADQIFKHTAYAAMGSDVADLNNDTYPEIVVADMLPEGNYRKKKMLEPNNYDIYLKEKKKGYGNQHSRNVLQVFQGISPETEEPLYSDIGIYSGIAETDWSWAPLLVDFNNDGWRDLLMTNGFPKAMTDNDFEEIFKLFPQFKSKEEVLEAIPSIKVSNYIYRNKGNGSESAAGLRFEDVTKQWGMDLPSFSYGVAHADLNNDGALDFVVNNVDEPAFIFQNRLSKLQPDKNHYLRIRLEGTAPNTLGMGTVVEIEYDNGKNQFHEHTLYRGYQSSVEPVVHFGLGDSVMVDKLTVKWPDSTIQELTDIPPNQVLTLHQKDAKEMEKGNQDTPSKEEPLLRDITNKLAIDYIHEEWDYNDFNVQPLLPHKLSQYGPGLSVGDVNEDSLDDIYISGSFDHKGIFLTQQQNGTFEQKDLLRSNTPKNREEELSSLLFDADGDGDNDLYIVSGSYEHPFGDEAYQDRLYINEGGKLIQIDDALPSFLSSGSAVRAADFDRDGDLDLFVGGRVKPHRYPEPVDSYILENSSQKGEVRFKMVNDNTAPVLNKIGMISDALWTDFNNDGWIDLILAGEWMSLKFLKNESGSFVEVTDQTGIEKYKGWWNSLCAGDFDSDGDTDYIAGNLGSNTHFQTNDEYPIRIYANDFDKNGMLDAIPSIYLKNKRHGEKVEVPYHGRQNLSQQIPAIQEEYETYQDFAQATMDDILSKSETSGMLTYQANHMKSSYVENMGDGRFKLNPLPPKAQWAPVYGCLADDVNNDGNLDIVLTGNDHGMELSTGKADALNGLILNGKGDGTFDVLDFDKSEFFVPGDAQALISLTDADNNLLMIASQNRGQLKSFKKNQSGAPISINPDDASALVHFKDGSIYKKEFYYGSGFLSQKTRDWFPPKQYDKIEIFNFQGGTRTILK